MKIPDLARRRWRHDAVEERHFVFDKVLFAPDLWKEHREEKGSFFTEKSKKLSEQWPELAHGVKKEYDDMAFKDNARYKKEFR
ncbi:hypothetical protein AAHA92_01288 [Salvia divinorum]|uniref:HMG box domain-containing protein n=1 Tax=Salvia divinorum TaxID=28513 RepID=A0ABD1IPQ5_SALDI